MSLKLEKCFLSAMYKTLPIFRIKKKVSGPGAMGTKDQILWSEVSVSIEMT